MKLIISLLLFIILPFEGSIKITQVKSDDIKGFYWFPKKDGKIEIFKRGNKYYGKTIWRKAPGVDSKNPDPKLRKQNLEGLEFLKDFEFNGDNEWINGTVYNPEDGNTYKCKMWLENEDLILKGYVGFSLIGKSQKLLRVRN